MEYEETMLIRSPCKSFEYCATLFSLIAAVIVGRHLSYVDTPAHLTLPKS